MQAESLHAAPIESLALANPLLSEADIDNWAEEIQPAGILPYPYPRDMQDLDWDYQVLYRDPTEEYLPDDQRYKGWKLVTAWTGVLVGSWSLMIGCVLVARALLA